MKEIVDVEIMPVRPARVTATELLEDFADAAPAWCFLEDDSTRYAMVRGRPGCVLRALGDENGPSVDFVFVGTSQASWSAMRIALIVPSDADEPLSGGWRAHWIRRFLSEFRGYVEPRGGLVKVTRIEAEEDVPAQA